MEKYAIIIQKYFRRYNVKKYIVIPHSYFQTKIWRKNRIWYGNGKKNECEKYQINLIEKICKNKLMKTFERFDINTYEIKNIKNPNTFINGYEITENFDGKIVLNNIVYYFNLKFICDSGGSQTRSLREVFYFIKYQLENLLSNNIIKIFINILDGDTCFENIDKFYYLLNKKKYKKVKKYVFIGSLYEFQKNKYKFFI